MVKKNKPKVEEPIKKEPAAVKDYLTTVKEYLTLGHIQILLLLTTIGILTRFYNLSFKSLWLDEASTLAMSKLSLTEIWNTGFLDNNPPLYHYLTHLMLVFGNSEFVLRFLPALMGIAVIPLIYLIGKELKDKNVGLVAASLMTFSPFALHYAQEAYSYSMVLFVSSLMILFYLKALRNGTRNNWMLFGAFSALSFWTHFYTFVPILVMYIHILITFRNDIFAANISKLKNTAYALIITFVASVPVMYMASYRFFTLTSTAVTYGVLGIALIPETLFRFSGFNWIIAAIYLCLMIVGIIYLSIKDKTMCLLSVMMMILPIVFSVILSSHMTMNPRYLIPLLPFFFVTIACCYPILEKIISNKRLIFGVIGLIILINTTAISSYYTSYSSEDWRGYSEKLTMLTVPGDIVVAVPGYMVSPLRYYYNNATDGTTIMYADTAAEMDVALSQKANHNVYFVVTGDINAANPQGDAVQWLNTKSKALGEYIGIYTFSA